MLVGKVSGKMGLAKVSGNVLHLNAEEAKLAATVAAGLSLGALRAVGSLGGLLLIGLVIATFIGGDRDEADKRLEKWQKDLLRPLDGICRIVTGSSAFYGVCLNDMLRYVFDGQEYEIGLAHVSCLECSYRQYTSSTYGRVFETSYVQPARFRLTLTDGSVFENIELTEEILFATPAGEVRFSGITPGCGIFGLNPEEAEKLPHLDGSSVERKRAERLAYPAPTVVGFTPDFKMWATVAGATLAFLTIMMIAVAMSHLAAA